MTMNNVNNYRLQNVGHKSVCWQLTRENAFGVQYGHWNVVSWNCDTIDLNIILVNYRTKRSDQNVALADQSTPIWLFILISNGSEINYSGNCNTVKTQNKQPKCNLTLKS